MKQFEYHLCTFDSNIGWFAGGGKVDLDSMHQQINELGSDGWELTTAFDTSRAGGGSRTVVLIFKREKQH